ncbi:uridine diphosphate-N-acetylglucosamine-binding protein YvcK [Rothia sp. AR01]|uniref:Putative gluconeogenesis factor n=1 Tax=Rothia santali TaxID=2949643 RepID=A0A9X2KJZ6_9MICC|nr:uridine diphosphate-N-acetylglucosamine-binding protein YvcK [Rothia santali]MCP3424496.1 uridine diphosphate-N-acetylglucosamine-binding protein YvcK [Rothia santali]
MPIPETGPEEARTPPPPRVTALGGGHGLYASLSALRRLTPHLDAVVTVADDGGSSGRLREQFGVLPPGDLRMALSALCDDSEWGHLWQRAMQHRFEGLPDGPHELHGHAMGNLIILALWQMLDDPVAGLEWAGRLLRIHGRVLPMALDPLVITGCAVGRDGVRRTVTGQARLAKEPRVEDVALTPADPRPCPESVASMREAEWVVLGPGSWFTSVIPHLLVPANRAALQQSDAKICVTMNLGLEEHETAGLGAAGHLEALARFAPELRVDAVIADPSAIDRVEEFEAAAARRGARVLWRRVRAQGSADVHDPLLLAAAYHEVMSGATDRTHVEPPEPSV